MKRFYTILIALFAMSAMCAAQDVWSAVILDKGSASRSDIAEILRAGGMNPLAASTRADQSPPIICFDDDGVSKERAELLVARLRERGVTAETLLLINDKTFPDEKFRKYILGNFSITTYKPNFLITYQYLSETERKTQSISIPNSSGIENLKGIEYFTSLKELYCNNGLLTALDLSKNTELEVLECHSNKLTTLDLSGCTNLTSLLCESNQFTALDLSGCTNLTDLHCGDNALTALNLSANTKLENLSCSRNALTALDLSKNTKLLSLNCFYNQLTELDVTGCSSLRMIVCFNNKLRGDGMTALINSLCDRSEKFFGHIELFEYPNAEEQNLCTTGHVAIAKSKNWEVRAYNKNTSESEEYAGLVEINAVNFPDSIFRKGVAKKCDVNDDDLLNNMELNSLVKLIITSPHLKSLAGIEFFTNLVVLRCDSTSLTELDLSKNTNLYVLTCSATPLTTLNVSGCTKLNTLLCENTNVTALDLRTNTALKKMSCIGSQLTKLDVSGCANLDTLYCQDNQLTELDVSGCTALEFLVCYKNQLTELDLRTNSKLVSLYSHNNQLTKFDVSGCTALVNLHCFYNQLPKLDLSGCPALEVVQCLGNKITGDAMTALVKSLSDRTGKNSGIIRLFDYPTTDEENICTTLQVAIAKGKNWTVQAWNRYLADYEDYDGVDPAEAGYLAINDTNFPNAIFRGVVTDNYDTDKDGYLSETEIAVVTDMDVSDKGIQSLKGIEHFTWLNNLYCYRNQLTELDLSANVALEALNCSENQLTELDLSKNTELKVLECNCNQLTALDLSKNTKLKVLNCSENQLVSLDVAGCTELEMIYCLVNKISGDAMTTLVTSLYDRTEKGLGTFVILNLTNTSEENVCTTEQVAIATLKYWKVQAWNGASNQLEDYAGSVPTAIRTVETDARTASDAGWYGIDGKKLPAEPTRRGIYIHGGRKVVK